MVFSLPLFEYFLTPPERPLPQGVRYWSSGPVVVPSQSTLYLLRREIKETGFGAGENVPEDSLAEQEVKHRLFATVMLIFSGIDLLAKFTFAGRGVGARFNGYCRAYLKLPPESAACLWKVRNSIMHSFGLYTADNRYVVLGNPILSDVVETVGQDTYRVSLSSLYKRFLESLDVYDKAVRSDQRLQELFVEKAKYYGFLHVAPLASKSPA